MPAKQAEGGNGAGQPARGPAAGRRQGCERTDRRRQQWQPRAAPEHAAGKWLPPQPLPPCSDDAGSLLNGRMGNLGQHAPAGAGRGAYLPVGAAGADCGRFEHWRLGCHCHDLGGASLHSAGWLPAALRWVGGRMQDPARKHVFGRGQRPSAAAWQRLPCRALFRDVRGRHACAHS